MTAGAGRSRIEAPFFDELYAERPDPWAFATSRYERAKYERTLAALGHRRFARALEVGCSIGVFTGLLAPRCDEVVAVDVAERALEQARERCANLGGVHVERRRLPEELPGGAFDLIVCSEVLYYWPAEVLVEALTSFEAALRPGGSLLAVHWRGPTEHYPLTGDEVHTLLAERLTARRAVHERHPLYLLDRFDREA